MEKELLLRSLRINLVPAPRVIKPGPATSFPVIYCRPDNTQIRIDRLSDCPDISHIEPGSYFTEILPVERVFSVEVEDLCETPDAGGIAVRAAYSLGMEEAVVSVGLGPGGPWVLDVTGSGVTSRLQRPCVEFAGSACEYIRMHEPTGIPNPRVYWAEFGPDRPSALQVEPGFPGEIWISSPAPWADVYLTTRLIFRGIPSQALLNALDWSAGVLSMLVSPVGEARERHGTLEGALGSFRLSEAGFEYLAAPSLLWNPAAMHGLTALVSLIPAHLEAVLGASLNRPEIPLEARYKAQRAYYNVNKTYFEEHVQTLERVFDRLPMESTARQDVQSLFDRALHECRAFQGRKGVAEVSGTRDFRPAWGVPVQPTGEPGIVLGEGPVAPACPELTVSAGARTILVSSQNVFLDPEVCLDSTTCFHTQAVRLNREAGRRLLLPAGTTLGILPPRQGRACDFRIGPVLGIMARESEKSHRFGVETDRFSKMTKMGEAMGMLVYVFFPDQIDYGNGEVVPWFYREKRGWQRRPAPLPDVVYDRYIPDILPDGSVLDVAPDLQEKWPGLRFVNSLEFSRACRDKLRSYGILAQDSFVSRHLPRTEPVRGSAQVAEFALEHRETFLKLRRGTGSRKVVFVARTGSPGSYGFRVSYRDGQGRVIEEKAHDKLALKSIVDAVTGDKSSGESYIVQEGIDMVKLPEGQGGTFEVRVIYQKGAAGKWLRTGMTCRVNPGSERFMIPGEERHRRVEDILGMTFPGESRRIKEMIRDVSRRVPRLLEASSGYAGEMSVDLGLDSTGYPWIIEVNSKPATLFRNTGAFVLRELSLLRVLNYALYLYRT